MTPFPPRRIVLVAFPDMQILDLGGPISVFEVADRYIQAGRPAGLPRYEILVAAHEAGPVRTSAGVELVASHALADVTELDTLIVPGGQGSRIALEDERLVAWVRDIAPRARRITSVCTGAGILAVAGLLDGRRATTHWAYCDALQELFPRVRVEPDAIYVRDGNVYSSAGVSAGTDLALALVEEDGGRDLALAVARMLVVFLKRPGGQSQFSAQLAAQLAEREPLRDLQAWIADHPAEDLSVERLAERVAMSPRHFARVFKDEVGVTPGRFVERARVEAARRLLEESGQSVEDVAAASGFGTAETMRCAFQRCVHVSPSAYRARFTLAEV